MNQQHVSSQPMRKGEAPEGVRCIRQRRKDFNTLLPLPRRVKIRVLPGRASEKWQDKKAQGTASAHHNLGAAGPSGHARVEGNEVRAKEREPMESRYSTRADGPILADSATSLGGVRAEREAPTAIAHEATIQGHEYHTAATRGQDPSLEGRAQQDTPVQVAVKPVASTPSSSAVEGIRAKEASRTDQYWVNELPAAKATENAGHADLGVLRQSQMKSSVEGVESTTRSLRKQCAREKLRKEFGASDSVGRTSIPCCRYSAESRSAFTRQGK